MSVHRLANHRSRSSRQQPLLWSEDPVALNKLLTCNDILPKAYIAWRARADAMPPPKAMMCAVLEEAVDCFRKQFVSPTWQAKRLGQQAKEWLYSDEPGQPFSFVAICNELNLDPQRIRRALKRCDERRSDVSTRRPHFARALQRAVA